MIFVTVGTHEQQFDRLVSYIDDLCAKGEINEEVIMQIGFCTYEPKNCKYSKLIAHKEITQYVEDARIVITHGGPASFIMPLQHGKTPIVVPRQERYGEHVNDHQLDFAKKVSERQNNIIVVENIEDLADTIKNYDTLTQSVSKDITSNCDRFCQRLGEIVDEMFK